MSGDDSSTFGGGSGEGLPDGVPDVGSIIDGKYRVEERIGIGGMGAVLRVAHLGLGERYAVKVLLPKRARDPEIIGRFLREARSAARIKSEYIARVADVGQLPNGSPYIVMEHLAGADLANVLDAQGALSLHAAVDYVLQACAGVAEAHALGIIHRDLKPSNLFLTSRSDGTPLVKVLDFGIAKAVDEVDQPTDSALTATTTAFGSPGYMSPEQIRSTKNVDFRTDVWGLGVILYELVAGRKPFDAETPLAVLAAIAADQPHSLRAVRPSASPELEAVILRCLEKDLTRRYASVADLADALAPFASGRVVSIGRIKRLARAPGQGAGFRAPELTPRAHAGDAPAVTDKSWTTSAIVPSSRRLWLVALGLVFVGAASTGYLVRGARPPTVTSLPLSPSTVDASPRTTGASGITPSPVSASPSLPSFETAATGPSASPAPAASGSASASAPSVASGPRRSPGPGRRPARPAGASPSATSPPPSSAKEAASVDPMANSH